jgi:hypothetical protein
MHGTQSRWGPFEKMCATNFRTSLDKAEAGRSQFEDNLGYTVRLSQKKLHQTARKLGYLSPTPILHWLRVSLEGVSRPLSPALHTGIACIHSQQGDAESQQHVQKLSGNYLWH